MKNVTIPENEYIQLVQTIQSLKAEIELLKSRFLPIEKKQKPLPERPNSPVARLRGVISLPPGFDYKDFLGDELLASYLSK